MKQRVFYDHCTRQCQPALARWRDHRLVRARIPLQVRPWLLDQTSLTEHLVRAGAGDFRVQVQRSCWGAPRTDERAALKMRDRERALLRETLLLVRGQPWVYARSVIPASTVTGDNRLLRSLGNRSLGSWLFQVPNMERDPFAVALLPPGNTLVSAELQQDTPLWGRRSRFVVNQRPLLVCEIFLPAFEPWPMIRRF